jgi:hypothetical protein
MNHITNPMYMPNPLLGNTTMQRQSSQQQYQSSLTFRSCQDTQTRTGTVLRLVLAFFSLTKPEHVW